MITQTGDHLPPEQGDGVTPASGQELFYPYGTSVIFRRASLGFPAYNPCYETSLKSGFSFKNELKRGEGVRRSLHRGHLQQPRLRTDAHLRGSVCEDESVLSSH